MTFPGGAEQPHAIGSFGVCHAGTEPEPGQADGIEISVISVPLR